MTSPPPQRRAGRPPEATLRQLHHRSAGCEHRAAWSAACVVISIGRRAGPPDLPPVCAIGSAGRLQSAAGTRRAPRCPGPEPVGAARLQRHRDQRVGLASACRRRTRMALADAAAATGIAARRTTAGNGRDCVGAVPRPSNAAGPDQPALDGAPSRPTSLDHMTPQGPRRTPPPGSRSPGLAPRRDGAVKPAGGRHARRDRTATAEGRALGVARRNRAARPCPDRPRHGCAPGRWPAAGGRHAPPRWPRQRGRRSGHPLCRPLARGERPPRLCRGLAGVRDLVPDRRRPSSAGGANGDRRRPGEPRRPARPPWPPTAVWQRSRLPPPRIPGMLGHPAIHAMLRGILAPHGQLARPPVTEGEVSTKAPRRASPDAARRASSASRRISPWTSARTWCAARS